MRLRVGVCGSNDLNEYNCQFSGLMRYTIRGWRQNDRTGLPVVNVGRE